MVCMHMLLIIIYINLPNFFPLFPLGFYIFQHTVNSLTSKLTVESVLQGSSAEPMPEVSLPVSTKYSCLCVMNMPEVSVLCVMHIAGSKLSFNSVGGKCSL